MGRIIRNWKKQNYRKNRAWSHNGFRICTDPKQTTTSLAHMLLTCAPPDLTHIREYVHQVHHNKLDKLRTRTLPHRRVHTAIIKLAKSRMESKHPPATLLPHNWPTTNSDHISSSLLEFQFHALEKSITSILLPTESSETITPYLWPKPHLDNQHHLHRRHTLIYISPYPLLT